MADDRMTLVAETAQAVAGLGDRVAQTIRDVDQAARRGRVRRAGSLPSDGKVIEDRRPPPLTCPALCQAQCNRAAGCNAGPRWRNALPCSVNFRKRPP
jgi:hypothetical protein